MLEDFTTKFTQKYGHSPKAGSAYVYDLVSMMIKTQEGSRSELSSQDLAKTLNENGKYISKLFGEVKIDKEGLFITEASVKIMKNKQAEFVKEIKIKNISSKTIHVKVMGFVF